MRKLVVTEFLTLDGSYDHSIPWQEAYSPDDGQFKYDELFESDALLLGRITYEGFAQYWPTQKGKNKFADRINNLPKYVASNTLKTLEWENSTILSGDIVRALQNLKNQEGQNILVYGSGNLVQTLLRNSLVDELRLMVFPLVLGAGKRLFNNQDRIPLKLIASRGMGDGVLLNTYVQVPAS